MDAVCPECGAPAVDGLSCFEQMAQVLGWEGQDPELAALHFLTVASYNLQHPAQFTEPALAGLKALYVEVVDGGWTNAQTRRRAVEMGTGQAKVLKPEAERRPVFKAWPMTVADVYLPDQPEGAPGRVKAWAATIRASL
jgi:hypothetical protein